MSDSTVTRLRALLAESAEARWEPAFSQEYESIEDVIAWVAESFSQRPDHTYLGVVQSEIPSADGGAGLLAITGNGPHSLAHAVLIAEALNALPALLDVAEAAREYEAAWSRDISAFYSQDDDDDPRARARETFKARRESLHKLLGAFARLDNDE